MALNPVFTMVSEEIIKQKKKEKEEEDWESVNTWTADGSRTIYIYGEIPLTPVFTRI